MDKFKKELERIHGKNNITTDDLWNDNRIQFARLISELDTAGAFTEYVFKVLEESTDLCREDIYELIDRAKDEFDIIKGEIK